MRRIFLFGSFIVLLISIPIGMYLVKSQQILRSRATEEGTRIEAVNSSGALISQTSTRQIQVRLTHIPSVFIPTPTPSSRTFSNSPIAKRVLLLIYNPIIESEGNRRLTNLRNWNDPDQLTSRFIADVRESSGGFLNFTIAHRMELDEYPVKQDGFRYTDSTYLDCERSGGSRCHNPDIAEYREIINRADACGRANRGEIDELWIWGGGWFGFWEANMAGPGGFVTNGPVIAGTSCQRAIHIMGFNYSRGEAEMFEDLGHRTEGTMQHVYGPWNNSPYTGVLRTGVETNTWEKFTLLDIQTPTRGGCGNAHDAVNAPRQNSYDRTNTRTVRSRCEDFSNYPNSTDRFTNVSCNSWGCTTLGYFRWFFSNLPRASGVGPDGKLNNWWKYIADFDNAVAEVRAQSAPSSTPVSNLATHFRIANDAGSLNSATEQVFSSNPTTLNWTLTDGPGQKTIYAQFKVDGNWQPTVLSYSLTYNPPATPTPSPSPRPSPTPTPSPSPTPSVSPIPIPTPSAIHPGGTSTSQPTSPIPSPTTTPSPSPLSTPAPTTTSIIRNISRITAAVGTNTPQQLSPQGQASHNFRLAASNSPQTFTITVEYSDGTRRPVVINMVYRSTVQPTPTFSPSPSPTPSPSPNLSPSPTLISSPSASPTPSPSSSTVTIETLDFDLNSDGKINAVDYSIFLRYFLQRYNP